MRVHHPLKNVLAALARPRAYEIVRRNQRGFDRLAFAEHVRRQFDRLEIGCVLDVGANRGQYRDFLRDSVGYTGRIISFEPIVDLATSLCGRAAAEDPQWQVHAHALGAIEEQRDLHVMRGTSYSSFFQPTEIAVKGRIGSKNVVERLERVTVRRLDDVVADGLVLGPGGVWLKVDTQGWDLEVLRGAPRTLLSISALQIELSVIPIYQGMPDYLTVLPELRRLGFEVGALTPVNRDELGRVIEFDCALVASRQHLQAHSADGEHDYPAGLPSGWPQSKRTAHVPGTVAPRSEPVAVVAPILQRDPRVAEVLKPCALDIPIAQDRGGWGAAANRSRGGSSLIPALAALPAIPASARAVGPKAPAFARPRARPVPRMSFRQKVLGDEHR